MNKILLSALSAILLFSACSKSGSNPSKTADQNTLLLGSWLVNTEHDKVYTLNTNTLVQDTTTTQFGTANQFRWYYIFKKNDSVYATTLPLGHGPVGNVHPDTTDYMTYTVNGKILNMAEGSPGLNYTIVQISATKLELENVILSEPFPGFDKLDQNTTYKFVRDTYYDKQ